MSSLQYRKLARQSAPLEEEALPCSAEACRPCEPQNQAIRRNFISVNFKEYL